MQEMLLGSSWIICVVKCRWVSTINRGLGLDDISPNCDPGKKTISLEENGWRTGPDLAFRNMVRRTCFSQIKDDCFFEES